MNFLKVSKITIFLFSTLFLVEESYANYDKRGMARFSIGLESGVSFDNYSINIKDDTQVLVDGNYHTTVIESSWDNVALWKNKINLNIPLFKIGSGNLLLQGFGAYGDSFSGGFSVSERLDPIDKEAAGYEYLYRKYEIDSIDFKAYDFSLNLAYQIPITPDGGENRDYYLFDSKVHSFLLPKIGYSSFNQKHSISGTVNYGQLESYTDSYTSSWAGPFFGFESVSYISTNHKVSVGGGLQYISYNLAVDDQSSTALLRSLGLSDDPTYDAFYLRDNNSIEADASGNAYSVNVGYSYQPGDHVSYDVNVNYVSTRIKNGDTTYTYRDGSTAKDKINEAGWDSLFLSLGITYNF